MSSLKTSAQHSLFRVEGSLHNNTSSTFLDNTRLPVHRWFRFSAGFSGSWAEDVIRERVQGRLSCVLDPFAGSATTLIAAGKSGTSSFGVEAHPFVFRVARAKLEYRSDPTTFESYALNVLERAASLDGAAGSYPELITRCFTRANIVELDRLRQSWFQEANDTPASQLTWLALVSILRAVSHVGTAPWQYVLPAKQKKAQVGAFDAFRTMIRLMAADMRSFEHVPGAPTRVLNGDARTCDGVPDRSIDLVLTSPPYANNYDYADATRLEMSFMGEVTGWGDLQDKVRKHLVRSCSQHVPEKSVDLRSVLEAEALSPIRQQLTDVCTRLAEVRLLKGGKKTYHLLVACYFHDMARVWMALRRVCKPGAQVCMVIGDSAPYGVYVPVAEWFGQLAEAAGFRGFNFLKTRDRNVKWKNRKHRVPLCEGQLWVEG